MLIKNEVKKVISFVLMISILSLSVLLFWPKTVAAQGEAGSTAATSVPVADVPAEVASWLSKALHVLNLSENTITAVIKSSEWAWHLVEELAKAAAMAALQEMTKETVNWINRGYAGSPLFLENPESFFNDITKFEIRTLVDLYGYDELKYPFGRDFALNTIYAYKSQLAENSAYSLSSYFRDDPVLLRNYQTNFNYGGWNAFLINTQYPQNNYLGFQMEANEELARRVQGLAQTAGEKVQAALAQGQGFLSPQMCQTNDKYNNLHNEFNQPSFKSTEDEEAYVAICDEIEDDAQYNACLETGYDEYDEAVAAEKAEWESADNPNFCPPRPDGSSGLVNTTPGTVVANQIIKSVQSPQNLKELAVNSGATILSAVFDQLINKLVDRGLNALASTASPSRPTGDEWSYNGLTLGSPATVTGYNDDPWAGPDDEIILPDFKKTVDGAIANTQAEIQMITDTLNELNLTWPEARTLDICIPGPDLKWQDRLNQEVLRYSSALVDPSAYKELQLAGNFFKDWINNKMITELPNSQLYIDSVDEIKSLSRQAGLLTDRRRARTSALTQLQSIKNELDGITTQPPAESDGEAKLVSLKIQYNNLQTSMANALTLSEAQNNLGTAKSKKAGLIRMTGECEDAREVKGWGVPGGKASSFSGPIQTTSVIDGLEPNTEQVIFCNFPIIGGYTHKMFVGPDIVRPQVPMVNAANVLPGVSINLSCNTIYEANILDYKGDLSGVTGVTEGP